MTVVVNLVRDITRSLVRSITDPKGTMDNYLLENGDDLLLEDGSLMLLE